MGIRGGIRRKGLWVRKRVKVNGGNKGKSLRMGLRAGIRGKG